MISIKNDIASARLFETLRICNSNQNASFVEINAWLFGVT